MLIDSSEIEYGPDRLRRIAIAFGKSNPWVAAGSLNNRCIHCQGYEFHDSPGHRHGCPWEEANKLVQEIESGYFDAVKCRYYTVIYAAEEENDSYLHCINVAKPNQYCEEHQVYYEELRKEREEFDKKQKEKNSTRK